MSKLSKSPHAPARAREASATERALEMRQRGASIREIAEALEVSKSTAHGYVTAALDELREHNRALAQQHLDLELARCDQLQAALAKKVEGGDVRAVEASLKVMERRARLLGLDAAQKLEHAGPDGGPIHLDAASILDGLARLAGDGPADPDAPEPASRGAGDNPA